MTSTKTLFLVVIWGCVVTTAVTGYYYSPNVRVRRGDDPKFFWLMFTAGTAGAVLATYLLLQTPI